ncbi:MAG: thymidine phosphorylase [Nanoarchaeota archaeon]|nr:thymidine phosphorylase [Nanoarchaeota archaeon]
MQLKIKFLKWSAGFPVVMLNNKTAENLGVYSKDRIILKTISKPAREISTIVDVIEEIVAENEILVSSELKEKLNLKKGQFVEVILSPILNSLTFIKKKLNNKRLSQKEIESIIKDIANNALSEAEIALFVSVMYEKGMNFKENIFLIKAILKTGKILKLKNKFIVDKHSIGGIPGNRTTPIVVSICASDGLIFPKTSSRAITTSAGTADTIEVLAPVEFPINKIKEIIKKTNACMVWGEGLGMVPADSKIIVVEKALRIDPESQLLASIMSKKLAVGSNYILIDIPYGKNAKVSLSNAIRLKQKFEKIGKYFRKKLEVVLTDGDQPIGNGIGPVLEMIDVLKVLDPAQQGPKDLEKKSVFLAGKLLEMTRKAKRGQGIKKAEEILNSGRAYKKFKQIIQAQGGAIKKLIPGKFKHNLLANKTGKILEINNKSINLLARIAGCPTDKYAGIYLYFHKNDKIKKNEKLLTIYSESESRLREAVRFYAKNKIIIIK